MIRDNLCHIAVLIRDRKLDCTKAPFKIHILRDLPQSIFAVFKVLHIMITDDIAQNCLRHIPAHISKMIEALIPLRIPRRLPCRKEGIDLHGN